MEAGALLNQGPERDSRLTTDGRGRRISSREVEVEVEAEERM
jgi:hypothetical protein